jgi:hypothetical protein
VTQKTTNLQPVKICTKYGALRGRAIFDATICLKDYLTQRIRNLLKTLRGRGVIVGEADFTDEGVRSSAIGGGVWR